MLCFSTSGKLKLLVVATLLTFTTPCLFADGAVLINKNFAPLSTQQVNEIAVDAYIYAYPLVLMEITRKVTTNVAVPLESGLSAPMNQLANVKSFPDAKFTDVVRPNADTLYSAMWFDVTAEPIILEIPASNGRYYLMPLLDMWSDIFASPGSRTTGNDKQVYAIASNTWQGTLPEGVQLLRSPTNIGWMIGRVNTNGEADYENVWKFQQQLKAAPLSTYGTDAVPVAGIVDPNLDMSAPVDQVAKLSGEQFFSLFAEITKNNAPHQNDSPILQQMSRIGIEPGKPLNISDPVVSAAIAAAPANALKKIEVIMEKAGTTVNVWNIFESTIGTYGTYYLNRAGVAYGGLGANTTADAIYPTTFVDSNGKRYSSKKKYRIHFDKTRLPPVNGFWSLTMYNDQQFFTENKLNRYSIGDHNDLTYNKDGSLDLYIQRESPGKDKESNWLPAPAEGGFTMNLRLYWPKESVLDLTWTPPPVKEVK